ncbi:hypothetical protein GQ53DRAFT_747326 [Thozetella sp. PMI_491]|nr:hypothetical protein GQ53DRAFT_747326 [Thozetella sp. PMI_491]
MYVLTRPASSSSPFSAPTRLGWQGGSNPFANKDGRRAPASSRGVHLLWLGTAVLPSDRHSQAAHSCVLRVETGARLTDLLLSPRRSEDASVPPEIIGSHTFSQPFLSPAS